jgi:lysophospholipase L1-like esterase
MMEKNICVFGDSITWGACDKEYGGWFNRLCLYNENNSTEDIYLYNLGIPGDTTKELVLRLDNECKFRSPTSIMIAIGINDTALTNNYPSTSYDKFITNIQILINLSKKYTEDITFIGLTPVVEMNANRDDNNIGYKFDNNKIIEYDNVIKNIATNNNLKYIYLYDKLNKDDISEDGVHPNSNGHEKIFNILKEQAI